MDPLEALPPECALHMMSFLPTRDLITMLMVSQSWAGTARAASHLWKRHGTAPSLPPAELYAGKDDIASKEATHEEERRTEEHLRSLRAQVNCRLGRPACQFNVPDILYVDMAHVALWHAIAAAPSRDAVLSWNVFHLETGAVLRRLIVDRAETPLAPVFRMNAERPQLIGKTYHHFAAVERFSLYGFDLITGNRLFKFDTDMMYQSAPLVSPSTRWLAMRLKMWVYLWDLDNMPQNRHQAEPHYKLEGSWCQFHPSEDTLVVSGPRDLVVYRCQDDGIVQQVRTCKMPEELRNYSSLVMNSRYIAHTQTASTLVSFFDWQKGIMLDWTIDLARALNRAPTHGTIWMNDQTLFFYDHKDNVSEEVVHGFHIGHLLQEGNEAPTSTNEPCKFYTLKRTIPDGTRFQTMLMAPRPTLRGDHWLIYSWSGASNTAYVHQFA